MSANRKGPHLTALAGAAGSTLHPSLRRHGLCFSVFWLPLSRAIALDKSVACPDITLLGELFTTACDWRIASLGWMYTLFFVLLGSSAAMWADGWSVPVVGSRP
jgi:hypothetical protein